MKTFLLILLLIVISTLAAAWLNLRARTEKSDIALKRIEDVPRTEWEALARKKIFFGHKSVGENVMEGVELLKKEYPLLRDINLAHGSIGENFQPASKLEMFEETVTNNAALDAAMIKFCYADVNTPTDADRLIVQYKECLELLKEARPDLQLIHFTLPIESPPLNRKKYMKEAVKRALLRPGVGEKNAARQAYNEYLMTLAGDEPVFDIATIESIGPNGRRHYYPRWGKKIYCMAPEYTDDGGHLNEKGRRVVAEQFLIFLAEWAANK